MNWLRRKIAKARRAAILTPILWLLLSPLAPLGQVFADAPDPVLASSVGNYVVNPDGTIKLTVNGNWVWTTHHSDCNTDRFAVGWNVDWNDASQPGNAVTAAVDVGALAGNSLNPIDNAVHYSANSPYCGVYNSGLGYNSGAWGPMSHTYPAGTTTFAACVVTYDIFSSNGGPKVGAGKGGTQAGGTNHNTDNSVEANASTPLGNGCFTANIQNLVVVKHVINDNGGTKTAGDFTMNVSAVNPTKTSFAGSEAGTTVQVGVGSYSVDETTVAGYTKTLGAGCSGSITAGQTKICTITNDDNPASLTLNKVVSNTHGGGATAGQWTLKATGSGNSPTNLSGTTGVTSGATFKSDTYTLSETGGPSGYSASNWTCTNNVSVTNSQITLAQGQATTCTITNSDIAPTLKLVKTVTNNNGGAKTTSDFQGKIDNSNVAWGSAIAVNAGSHTASEVSLPTYSASSWGGDCTANGTITLVPGQNATCTITNDDIAPSLTLNKLVSNTHGGTASIGQWTLTANGAGNSPTNLSGTTPVASGSNFKADTYTLGESGGPSGYSASAWSCTNGVTPNGQSQITLDNAKTTTCTITNTDVAPTLTVTKLVVNPYGTAAAASSFPLFVDNTSVTSGTPTTQFNAGNHTVSETQQTGYSLTGVTGNCALNNNVIGLTLSLGTSSTCTLTNTAIQPKLIVKKHVINDNSGTKTAGNFTMTVTGNPVSVSNFAGSEAGTTINLNEGSYSVNELADSGYTKTLGTDCSGTIAIGQTKTCTVTNDDIAPTLKLVKQVVNGSGGNKTAADWTLSATGTGGFSDAGNSTTFHPVGPNIGYVLSESTIAGYAAGSWSCNGGSLVGSTITLSLGQNVTCTITNSELAPTLKLVKSVTNNNGGTKTPANWTLSATGTGGFSDAGNSTTFHPVGTNIGYALSESTVSGYAQSGNWVCDTGTLVGSTVTLTSGQNATCTITNDDIAPSLTLNKLVSNTHGGTATASQWALTANGAGNSPTNLSGTTPVASGSNFKADTYTLGESGGPSGYSGSLWTCTNGVTVTNSQITLDNAKTTTCTITNTDVAPTLTVTKLVVNPYGTAAAASSFPLFVDNTSVTSGTPTTQFNAGNHTVSETQQTGYSLTGVTGNCALNNNVIGLTLSLGTSSTCTLTNTAIQPKLIVKKHVINDNSGTKSASDFTMTVTGNPVSVSNFAGSEAGTTINLNEGSYSVDELADSGYTKTLGTDCSGTIAIGQTKTCTITNNDVAHPSVHVAKSGPATAHDGDTVTYTFTVTNTGDTALSGVTVNDDIAGAGTFQSGDTNDNGFLDKSETWIYTKDYVIPTDQTEDIYNTATVCANYSDTNVCDSDHHTLDVLHPSIEVAKYGPATAFEGDTVTYNFTVTNSGDTTLTNVGIADDLATGETCLDSTLAAGESTTCTATYTIPTPQIADVTNHVTASGTDPLETTVTGTDQHTLDVLHPSIKVVKTGPSSAAEGSTVTYTFTVTNTGDMPLNTVTVNDDIAGVGTYQSGDTNNNSILDLTETWVYTAKYTIPNPQATSVVNTATVCGFYDIELIDQINIDSIESIGGGINQSVCATDKHTTTIARVLGVSTTKVLGVTLVNTGQSIVLTVVIGSMLLTSVLVVTRISTKKSANK